MPPLPLPAALDRPDSGRLVAETLKRAFPLPGRGEGEDERLEALLAALRARGWSAEQA